MDQMTNRYSEKGVLAALKAAIVCEAERLELGRLGISGGRLIEAAKPMEWLAYLEQEERYPFHNWLWAISRPINEGEKREIVITTQAGYNLRKIADRLNLAATAGTDASR
jgi:hypothetical protein